LDEVLHYWSGLGYYARARNLHHSAQQVCSRHDGILPTDREQLMRLPGIGRSTAGAILALAYGQRQPILDGNVKRVLCRYYAITGVPTESAVISELWHLAEKNLPDEHLAAYTQAIMDLGATVCTRRHPQCALCPFHQNCAAHQQRQEDAYPVAKPRQILPVKTTTFIMLQNVAGAVLLEQRPLTGIWGGLWSFPECANPNEVKIWCQRVLDLVVPVSHIWRPFRHTFTHFHLDITPVHVPLAANQWQAVAFFDGVWYNSNNPQLCGLAAPVVRLLTQLDVNKGELLI
jgi:A/G-specific adenine glycosylase